MRTATIICNGLGFFDISLTGIVIIPAAEK